MNAGEFWQEVSAFRAFNRSKDLSPKTIKLYDHALRQFHEWLIEAYGEDAEITARRVRGFMTHRLEGGNAPRTVKSYVGALRTFFGFLVMDGIISEEENAMHLVKNPKLPQKQIRPLGGDEIHRLLDSFDKHSPAQYRDYVICCLILDTGLRIGEVARLTMEDIDFERSCLAVNGKGRKRRKVFMGRRMKSMLLDYLDECRPVIANGHRTLFPPTNHSTHARLQIEHLSGIIREKMDEAGIPRCRSSGHRLRHTFATNFIKAGGNVVALKRLLGHSSLTMTMKYVMLADDDLAEAYRKASPLDRMAI